MSEASVRRVVLGVAGGIACYKVCEVVRRLREGDCDVTVVSTQAALNFVGAATWEALSGHPVATGVFEDVSQVRHVQLGAQADLVIVAPATADLLARAASGRADDLLTNVLLTATCPVVMFPAMHTQMWQHGATVANVATLRSRGIAIKDPASGRLTGQDSGPGRLPEPGEIIEIALAALDDQHLTVRAAEQDLTGVRVLVTAGGTREWLDPVRYLGNSSSGLMGVALAAVAALRGAQVTLVTAHTEVAMPSGVEVVEVVSTGQLADAVLGRAGQADIVVMAAAPADFTPLQASDTKIKKTGPGQGLTLELAQTTDILAALGRGRRPGQVLVGFAAETAPDEDLLLELGRAKLARKGADLLVLNDVSGGKVFGRWDTAVTIIDSRSVLTRLTGTKAVAAMAILDAAAAKLADAKLSQVSV